MSCDGNDLPSKLLERAWPEVWRCVRAAPVSVHADRLQHATTTNLSIAAEKGIISLTLPHHRVSWRVPAQATIQNTPPGAVRFIGALIAGICIGRHADQLLENTATLKKATLRSADLRLWRVVPTSYRLRAGATRNHQGQQGRLAEGERQPSNQADRPSRTSSEIREK